MLDFLDNIQQSSKRLWGPASYQAAFCNCRRTFSNTLHSAICCLKSTSRNDVVMDAVACVDMVACCSMPFARLHHWHYCQRASQRHSVFRTNGSPRCNLFRRRSSPWLPLHPIFYDHAPVRQTIVLLDELCFTLGA